MTEGAFFSGPWKLCTHVIRFTAVEVFFSLSEFFPLSRDVIPTTRLHLYQRGRGGGGRRPGHQDPARETNDFCMSKEGRGKEMREKKEELERT